MSEPKKKPTRYEAVIEKIFVDRYQPGHQKVSFLREDLEKTAADLGIQNPKNLGDLVYSFRFRSDLPSAITDTAPDGLEWTIKLVGRAQYDFILRQACRIEPNPMLDEIKVPDATPGLITAYALSDEQALLAKLRYNRLIDIFTGVTCYSLQNHLRTQIPGVGQTETDELYVGIDKRGAQFVFPVQAKGGTDKLGIVQIEQDLALCSFKFQKLVCRPLAAQFMADEVIALFELRIDESANVKIVVERHYRLVPPDEVGPDDLERYRLASE